MIIKEYNFTELDKEGFTIVKNVVDENWLNKLSRSVDISLQHHKNYQIKNNINGDIRTDGVALHALLSSDVFLEFIEHLINIGFIKQLESNFFNSKCILNSFSALNNIKNNPNFSSKVHRDLRFYSGRFPMMLNCLIMIDKFTIENGATYLLPKSHLDESDPTDDYFFGKSIQSIGDPGDILIFNSNVWHASAPNKTDEDRRAIPFTVSKSFMKQLLDYPRAIGYERMNEFSYKMQQSLGYHSRVPSSLDEWYQPEEYRFYKKDQDSPI
jgi:ectoine hydroxylase-related dioxygenase (phytanoyl-CoA dioxygenase family)